MSYDLRLGGKVAAAADALAKALGRGQQGEAVLVAGKKNEPGHFELYVGDGSERLTLTFSETIAAEMSDGLAALANDAMDYRRGAISDKAKSEWVDHANKALSEAAE